MKRIDLTSKTLTEVQERLDKLSEKRKKDGKDGEGVTPKLEEIKQQLKNLYHKVPEIESKSINSSLHHIYKIQRHYLFDADI